MSERDASDLLPTEAELRQVFHRKFGPPETTGWAPRRRWQFSYFLPAEIYEATINKLVQPGMEWIDVGGGQDVFPENPRLAEELVARAGHVVGVDPSANIHQNRFVQERAQCLIEDFQTDRQFDLATLRMVVEHVVEPQSVARSLRRLLKPGGMVVIFTINLWAPISLVSRIMPFRWHHPVKRFFWGGKEEDTFPVQYKMNTRETLRRTMQAEGLQEIAFLQPDHLAMFGDFRWMNYVELSVWKGLRAIGFGYPENCLLGIYRKTSD